MYLTSLEKFALKDYWEDIVSFKQGPRLIANMMQVGLLNLIYHRPKEGARRIDALTDFLHEHFGPKGFTDTAFDRMGARAGEFLKTSLRCREPYLSPTETDVTELRQWYRQNLPEMLEL